MLKRSGPLRLFPVSPVRDGVRLVVHDRHRERSQPRRGADVHSGRNQPVLRGVVWRVCRETSVCLHERLRFRERETKVSKGEVRERVLFLAAGFMFGLSFAKTLKQVYGFGILMTVCVSGAYASVDGILVCAAKGENTKMKEGREEEMRRIGDQNTTEGEDALEEEGENNNTSRRTKNRRITQVNVQTVAMATRTFAAILGSACSVLFLEMFTARATIALSSVFAILAAFIALKIEERSNGGVEEGTDVDLEMRRRRSTTTTTTATIITTIKSKKWPWRRFFRDREFIAIALALFIYRITPTAMDTYNSFVYSIYDEKLPNSAFGMFQFFSSVGALFGAFAFPSSTTNI